MQIRINLYADCGSIKRNLGKIVFRCAMSTVRVYGLDNPIVWTTDAAFLHLQKRGLVDTKRTAERRLHDWKILPQELRADELRDELGRPYVSSILAWEIDEARAKRKLVLYLQLLDLPNGCPCLHANDTRGARTWIPFETNEIGPEQIERALCKLQKHLEKPIAVFPHGDLVSFFRKMKPLPPQASPHILE
jgi:sulfate adenylyltransferase subunit 2